MHSLYKNSLHFLLINSLIIFKKECISLQHQLNIIRNVIDRLDSSLDPNKAPTHSQTLASASRDKLRTLSESLVEILLHFTIEYGAKVILSMDCARKLS